MSELEMLGAYKPLVKKFMFKWYDIFLNKNGVKIL